MIRVFVDSGSSIKANEASDLGVELLPLRILLGDKEYLDGIDLDLDEFYNKLISDGLFPKTSLPPLEEAEEKIKKYTDSGDEVIVVTISSGISATCDVIRSRFKDNDKVFVVDSRCAVGGMRILVHEINKYRDLPAKDIVRILDELIPRIKIVAVPETLDYLHKGGRLRKAEYLIGSILKIKPLIGFKDGKVHVEEKAIGLTKAKRRILDLLDKWECDTSYPIVPSYTYSDENLKDLISKSKAEYQKAMIDFDNLDPAIACHWGPNAFGFIFVGK